MNNIIVINIIVKTRAMFFLSPNTFSRNKSYPRLIPNDLKMKCANTPIIADNTNTLRVLIVFTP